MPDETPASANPPSDAGTDNAEIEELADLLTGLYEENTANEPTTQPAESKPGEGEPPPDASPSDEPSSSDAQSHPSPTPDFSSPEAQEFLDRWYADRKAAEERQSVSAKSLEELDALVQGGRYDELGERFAREYSEAKAKRDAGGEVLKEFLTETYQKIFADPVFQNLTDAEKVELDPNRFSSDVEYIDHLRSFTATKKAGKSSEEDIEQRVQERLKALANERRGVTVGSPSATGLPAADPRPPVAEESKRPSGDLVAEGMREEYARKQGIAVED